MALGLILVYGILHLPNFAHGSFYMAGAYVTSTRTASLTSGEKTLTSSYFSSSHPHEAFPHLIGLYRAHSLKLDELITRTCTIVEAQQAFAEMQSGRNARGVIIFE